MFWAAYITNIGWNNDRRDRSRFLRRTAVGHKEAEPFLDDFTPCLFLGPKGRLPEKPPWQSGFFMPGVYCGGVNLKTMPQPLWMHPIMPPPTVP